MVKFGQKLRDNSVVEWHEEGAYVNYKGLKKLIKKLVAEKEAAANATLGRRPSFAAFFSGGTASPVPKTSDAGSSINCGGGARARGNDVGTEMRYLLADEPSPVFEAAIHDEMAKVNTFYEKQVQTCLARLELLREQAAGRSPGDEAEAGEATPAAAAIERKRDSGVRGGRAESIKQGAVALFRDLSLLENYTMLNYTAFVKIVKKHDKMLHRRLSEKVMPIVSASPFCRAELAHSLLKGVEVFFSEIFCNGERRVARSALMMKHREDSRARGGASLGVRSGICVTLALWVVWDGYMVKLEQPDPLFISETPAFPIFRMVFGLLLLLWCWGVSVRVWVEARINYIYMMGFRPKASRSSAEIFQEATNMTIVCLVILLLYYKSLRRMAPLWVKPHLYPVILWFYVHVKLLFPWNARRKHLFAVLAQVVASPFTEVTFFHSIVGDYLTSVVKILIDYAFSWCYLLTGEFLYGKKMVDSGDAPKCLENPVYTDVMVPLMCALPLWFRLQQNLRRFYDTGQHWPNLGNALKYALSQVVVIFGAFHGLPFAPANVNLPWRNMWLFFFFVSYSYSFLWDVCIDWGLGRPQHALLNKHLMFSRRWCYYAAMVLDFFGRFAWTLTLVPPKDLWAGWDITTALMAVELVRRTVWSFFRVENEHLHRTSLGFRRQSEFIPFHFETDVGLDNKPEVKSRWRQALESTAVLAVVVAFSVAAIVAGDRKDTQAAATTLAPSPSPAF